ncbi:MAG: tetratricopeptide repeat protein [Chthoniobacterales bacterium]
MMSRHGVLLLLAAALTVLLPQLEASPDNQIAPSPGEKNLIARAERAFSAGNLKEAEALYAKASATTPDSVPLLVSLAAVKTRLGKTEESRTLLRRALSHDLGNGAAWLLLGMNALEQNNDAEAVADLMQAVCHDGKNPRAHNYLGIAAGRRGWSEVSEQELRRAVELNPDYADANFNLAVFYIGRTPPLIEQARRHYQRALDLGATRDAALEARIAKSVANPSSAPAPSATIP